MNKLYFVLPLFLASVCRTEEPARIIVETQEQRDKRIWLENSFKATDAVKAREVARLESEKKEIRDNGRMWSIKRKPNSDFRGIYISHLSNGRVIIKAVDIATGNPIAFAIPLIDLDEESKRFVRAEVKKVNNAKPKHRVVNKNEGYTPIEKKK